MPEPSNVGDERRGRRRLPGRIRRAASNVLAGILGRRGRGRTTRAVRRRR